MAVHDLVSVQIFRNDKNEIEMMHKRYSITKKWKPTDRGDDERLVVIAPDEAIPPMENLVKSHEMLPTRSDSIEDKPVKQFLWLATHCDVCSGRT